MKASIDFRAARHAHETPEHLADKIVLAQLFEKFDFDYVLLEHDHADVIGVRCCGGIPQTTACELERSTRNLLRNLERNARQGAAGTVVVCEDYAILAAVARKLARSLPLALGPRVGLTNLTTLKLLHPTGDHDRQS